MNRHQRRARAAKDRATRMRHAAVEDALAYIAELNDPSISGATVFLPDGQVLHVSAEMARAAAPEAGERH